MRPVREITAEEENFRAVPMGPFDVVRRDSVEPEPIGTIVLAAFRVVGYDKDLDGSLMARLEQIDRDGSTTGWRQDAVPLYPDTELVVTAEELRSLFAKP